MNENPDLINSLIQRVRELILTYFELIKLKAVASVSSVISTFFSELIVGLLLVLFLFFLNLAAAFWLGDLLGKVYFGFLAVSAFYFILGIFSHIFLRRWLKNLTVSYFIRQFLR